MNAAFRRAALAVYVHRVAAALVVGYPAARAFGAVSATSLPDGDLVLFSPGGVHLLEALRLGSRSLRGALESATLATVVLGALSVVPLTFALASLSTPEADAKTAVVRAVDRLSQALLVVAFGLLAKALALLATSLVFGVAAAACSSWVDERLADLVPLGVGAACLAGVALLGLLVDVALAIVVKRRAPAFRALRSAWGTLRARGTWVLRAWALAAGPSLLVVLAAGWAAELVDVGRPGALRVLGVLFVHQAAALGVVVLRLRFFATLLAAFPEPHEAPAGQDSGARARASG